MQRLESIPSASNRPASRTSLLFTLGTYPEVTEEESQPGSLPNRNDTIETAEPVRSSPVVVNGTLRGPERDVYRVYGKAGERRVFELEARRCGSAIDPVLRILDGAGKQLARNDDAPGAGLDARLDFTFPSEGNYYVEVTDARFSTQAQNFYRLKMGAYRYADGIFPLGGRRGDTRARDVLRRQSGRQCAHHRRPQPRSARPRPSPTSRCPIPRRCLSLLRSAICPS